MEHLLKCLSFLHHTDHDHGIKAHGPTGNAKEMIMRHNANLRVRSGDPGEPSSMGLALSWEPVALRSHDLSCGFYFRIPIGNCHTGIRFRR